MPKNNRLSRADFSKLRPLRKEQGRFFTLTLSRNTENKPKFASVVSKKIARKANARNLIKRRLRAAFREIAPKFEFSFVFTAKRSASDASFQEILADVGSLIVKTTASLK